MEAPASRARRGARGCARRGVDGTRDEVVLRARRAALRAVLVAHLGALLPRLGALRGAPRVGAPCGAAGAGALRPGGASHRRVVRTAARRARGRAAARARDGHPLRHRPARPLERPRPLERAGREPHDAVARAPPRAAGRRKGGARGDQHGAGAHRDAGAPSRGGGAHHGGDERLRRGGRAAACAARRRVPPRLRGRDLPRSQPVDALPGRGAAGARAGARSLAALDRVHGAARAARRRVASRTWRARRASGRS